MLVRKKFKRLISNRLELGLDNNVAFDPDSNTSPDDERDNVGEEEGDNNFGCRESLPLLLLDGGDGALGGNTALKLPLLGREDVGPGAPVPDEL